RAPATGRRFPVSEVVGRHAHDHDGNGNQGAPKSHDKQTTQPPWERFLSAQPIEHSQGYSPPGREDTKKTRYRLLGWPGKKGNSARTSASEGRRPYSQISKASAYRMPFAFSGPYHLASAVRTAGAG